MKLFEMGLIDEPLLEGVKTSPSVLGRAITGAKDMGMGFEVEFFWMGETQHEKYSPENYDDLKRHIYDYYSWDELNNELELDGSQIENIVDHNKVAKYVLDHEDEHERIIRSAKLDDFIKDDSSEEDKITGLQQFFGTSIGKNAMYGALKTWFLDDSRSEQERDTDFLDALFSHEELVNRIRAWGERSSGVDGSNEDLEEAIDEVSAGLEDMFSEDVEKTYEYHGHGDKDLDTWYVEPDSNMVEISSPVKEPIESLSDMEVVFDEILKHDQARTTEKSGLHISLSFKTKPSKKPDWVKLAVLLGEEDLLKAFKREFNGYTTPQRRKIQTAIDQNITPHDDLFKDPEAIKKAAKEAISKEKNSAFNISGYEDTGRIEFRIGGNEGYENKYDTIKNMVGRFIFFLKIATSDQYKKEYLKKLGTMVISGRAGDMLTNKAPNKYKGESPKKQKQIIGIGKLYPKLDKSYLEEYINKGFHEEAADYIASEAASQIGRNNFNPNLLNTLIDTHRKKMRAIEKLSPEIAKINSENPQKKTDNKVRFLFQEGEKVWGSKPLIKIALAALIRYHAYKDTEF